LAAAVGDPCWHAFGAAQKIADLWHDGTIPEPDPDPVTVPEEEPEARVPWPPMAMSGFYD
jgi:hypothetical protein